MEKIFKTEKELMYDYIDAYILKHNRYPWRDEEGKLIKDWEKKLRDEN